MPDLAGVPDRPHQWSADILENGPRRRLGVVASRLSAGSPTVSGNYFSVDDFADNYLLASRASGDDDDDWERVGTAITVEGPQRSVRRRFAVTACLIALLGVALAVLLVAPASDRARQPAPSAAPTQEPSGLTPSMLGGYIDSVESDSEPVGTDELFTDAQMTVGGHSYTRVARQLDIGCPDIVGAGTATLVGDRCRQLIRALYVSDALGQALGQTGTTDRRVFAAVAVAVTDNQATAARAAANADTFRVSPLELPEGAVPDATTLSFNESTTMGRTSTLGHYVISIVVAYTDGGFVAANDEQLRAVVNDLRHVASRALQDRADLAGA